MKFVYDERYGRLWYSTRAAIRKYNVSPADYSTIVETYGDDVADQRAIRDHIVDNSPDGMYRMPRDMMMRGLR